MLSQNNQNYADFWLHVSTKRTNIFLVHFQIRFTAEYLPKLVELRASFGDLHVNEDNSKNFRG